MQPKLINDVGNQVNEGVVIASDIKALAVGVTEETEKKKTDISDIINEKSQALSLSIEESRQISLPALTASEFLKLMREKRAVVELDNKLANRSVNEGFSGGEKKRNEIFQMAMLEPKLSFQKDTGRYYWKNRTDFITFINNVYFHDF